jgi:hypothetical protein
MDRLSVADQRRQRGTDGRSGYVCPPLPKDHSPPTPAANRAIEGQFQRVSERDAGTTGKLEPRSNFSDPLDLAPSLLVSALSVSLGALELHLD